MLQHHSLQTQTSFVPVMFRSLLKTSRTVSYGWHKNSVSSPLIFVFTCILAILSFLLFQLLFLKLFWIRPLKPFFYNLLFLFCRQLDYKLLHMLKQLFQWFLIKIWTNESFEASSTNNAVVQLLQEQLLHQHIFIFNCNIYCTTNYSNIHFSSRYHSKISISRIFFFLEIES